MLDHPLLIFDIPAGYGASSSTMCTTTPLGLQPTNDFSLPKPVHCPINGFEGSWYYLPFDHVPIYNRGDPGVKQNISWADIDDWAAGVANVWVTTGTCLGLCLAVLAYLIALTPNKKKSTPFHTGLMLALIFEVARLLCDIGRAADIGLSPYSAYLGLTNDFGATTYSTGFQLLEVIGMVCATLASLFTFACLYLQATGLLTGVHNRHRAVYLGIICYLLTTSVVALAFRITITVIQALYTSGRYQSFSLDTYRILRRTTSIAYAVSIGSWCSVSFASVSWLMFTRSKLIVSNRPYDTALTLLSLVFMESMVIPMLFTVLQAFQGAKFPLAELVVIPSVLVLLPMGSLFMTLHTVEAKSSTNYTTNGIPASAPHLSLPSELDSRPRIRAQAITVVNSIPLTTLSYSDSRTPLVPNAVDRELQSIDNMSTPEENRMRGSEEFNRMLEDRRGVIANNLKARSITPRSSNVNIV